MNALECSTRYPFVLVHGTGFRDWGYWGRIPRALEQRGAKVFFGGQDGWATVEHNAGLLKARVEEVLAETGCERVHIIAHSKGGLDCRYAITHLGLAPCVASLTTINTPHRGVVFAQTLLDRLPSSWVQAIAQRYNAAFEGKFVLPPVPAEAEEFNRANPDVEGVLYRSYAGAMRSWRSDLFMWWQNLIIGLVEGENDGLVTAESAQWTGFQGVWRGAAGRGVSHMDEVDFRRRPLRRRGEVFDVVDEYIRMAAQLKELGL